MPENNGPEQGFKVLTLNDDRSKTILMPKSDLGKGWERNTFGVIVPSGQVLAPDSSGVLNKIGLGDMSIQEGAGVVSVARGVITDPGNFKVKTSEEEMPISDSTEVAKAIQNPGQFIIDSLAKRGEVDPFKKKKVTKDIFDRKKVEKTYFDKNTGKTETIENSSSGLMEKYLTEAVDCISNRGLINSEAHQRLSSHASELLKNTRLEMEIEQIPEMPDLVEAVIDCLSNEKISFDVNTRKNLYEILEQVMIPNSLLEEVEQVIDKNGDLGHDLALKLFFELRKEKPDCDFLKHQKERREEMLSILSGTPQEIYENFSDITQMAMGLVVGVDMDDLTEARIGIECEYKPDPEMLPVGNIPDRFEAGTDVGQVVEIRTNDEKLGFDEAYMESLYRLETWLGDQPKEKLATLHLHLDTEVHPKTSQLMEGMIYLIKNNLGTEVWGMGLPSNASGLINYINFLAIGSKEKFDVDQKINISENDDLNWQSLLGGYYCCRLTEPESRLAAILAMRGEKNSVLFNPLELFSPIEILLKYNFSEIKGIERLEIGLIDKQKVLFNSYEKALKLNNNITLNFLENKSLIYTEMLRDDDEIIRSNAIEVLQSLENLPRAAIDRLTEMLCNSDETVSYTARLVLKEQKSLPVETVNRLMEMLSDSHSHVIDHAVGVLQSQTNLPVETVNRLMEMLDDRDEQNCFNARIILKRQKNFTKKVFDKLTVMIGDYSENTRDQALIILKHQDNLPREMVDRLSAMLDYENEDIKDSALGALENQKNLPNNTIDRLMVMLRNDNEYIKHLSQKVLQNQKNFSKEIIGELTELIDDSDEKIRDSAFNILRYQDNLPIETIDRLLEGLTESNESVSYYAHVVLAAQRELTQKTNNRLVEILFNSNKTISSYVCMILRRQNNLSIETVNKLTVKISDGDENIRSNSMEILQYQKDLPIEPINKLTEMLGNNNEKIRSDALEVLRYQKNLPNNTIDRLIKILDKYGSSTNDLALRLLVFQENLSKETIGKISNLIRSNKIHLNPDLVSLIVNPTKNL